MSSPIDCSSTGASSGASSPTSDGLDGRRPAASTTVQEPHAHDDQEHDGLGPGSHEADGIGNGGHVRTDNENHGNRNPGREEHDLEDDLEDHDLEEHDLEEHDRKGHGNGTIDEEVIDGVVDKGSIDDKVVDEENIDDEIGDGHTEAGNTDDGVGHEEVEIGLLPRDNNPRRDTTVCFLTLMSCLLALAAVVYSAREPLPAYLTEPAQMPAWLANLELGRPEVLVPLDGAGSVRAIAELYEPFMGDGVGLLAARPWPSGDAPSLMTLAIPGADFENLGGTLTFFDDLSRNVTEFCATVEDAHSTPAGDTRQPHDEGLHELCRHLITLSRSASAAYIEVAYGLAGPHQGTRWLQQVRAEVLDLAGAAAGPGGDAGLGHTFEGEADYLAANASTSERLRGHVGRNGSWQAINSKFKGSLLRLYRGCKEIEAAWVNLAPVARSFIAGTRASAARDAAPGSLHAQVTGDWLQLESAVAVVQALALAAEDGVKALTMAQYRLQELHDKLGCVKRACTVAGHVDDGSELKVRFTLAGPSVLHDMLVGTADWLGAQGTDLHGVTSGDN